MPPDTDTAFAKAWSALDVDERRRRALEWVVLHVGTRGAAGLWLANLAQRSAAIHGAGLTGVVDTLVLDDPQKATRQPPATAGGGQLGKLVDVFVADMRESV